MKQLRCAKANTMQQHYVCDWLVGLSLLASLPLSVPRGNSDRYTDGHMLDT